MLLLLLLICGGLCCRAERVPHVSVDQGKMGGIFLNSTRGREFAAFMSIPFAEPPVGNLRFKSPVAAKGWKGTRDASVDSPICIQNNPYTRDREVSGTEDCLYLNVYTPKLPRKDGVALPVMVFFHGGGWMCGSGNRMFYGPERLMDKDVVYVGVNYRLGALAYFSTMDTVAPGNYALKDQNMALQWIQKNVERFGGDPNSVTIFGESAGGSSVHYHMLSPKSKGLFHKAISQSGTAFCVWANPAPGIMKTRAELLAQVMDCPTDSSSAIVECLRTKSAKELIEADTHFYDWDYDPMIPFKPTVEPEHEDAFMTEDPRVLAAEGRFHQVPWMLGLNSMDGAIRTANIYGNPHLLKDIAKNFDKIAPITFDYQAANNVDQVTEEIKKFYFDDLVSITNDSTQPLTDIYTDAWFLSGIDETVQFHLPKSEKPIYFYLFDYRGTNSFTEIFGDPWRDYGTCHADELIYLFNLGLFKALSAKDLEFSDVVLTLWTNFASTGNPTKKNKVDGKKFPEWKPVTSLEKMEYYRIGNKLSMESNLLEKRRHFWNNLNLWHKQHSNAYAKQRNEKTEL